MPAIFQKIMVTGAAGFIGAHVCLSLLKMGYRVYGVDNMSPYYDVKLKEDRLNLLKPYPGFEFHLCDISDYELLAANFENFRPDAVINLAANPGVRYSIQNPHVYGKSNLIGFLNILECCRHYNIKHLVYASSSSVYGANQVVPFATDQNVDHPISLYAATKKANELMAHSYSHLYQIPVTGLRFFTVYGPWGRPDMAMYMFTKAIFDGEPLKVYNHGEMRRDFTYIDDIVNGVVKVLGHVPTGKPDWDERRDGPDSSAAPYRIYNIGNNRPVDLEYFIGCIEKHAGRKARKIYMEMQPGDMPETYADIDSLKNDVGFEPKTPVDEGVRRFVEWYRMYHNILDAPETQTVSNTLVA